MKISDRQKVVREKLANMGKECESLVIRHQRATEEVAGIVSEQSRLLKELEITKTELDELDELDRLAQLNELVIENAICNGG